MLLYMKCKLKFNIYSAFKCISELILSLEFGNPLPREIAGVPFLVLIIIFYFLLEILEPIHDKVGVLTKT